MPRECEVLPAPLLKPSSRQAAPNITVHSHGCAEVDEGDEGHEVFSRGNEEGHEVFSQGNEEVSQGNEEGHEVFSQGNEEVSQGNEEGHEVCAGREKARRNGAVSSRLLWQQLVPGPPRTVVDMSLGVHPGLRVQ